MEEKERYELFGEFGIIHDTSPNAECMLLNKFQTCEILNRQDKRIKELEQENAQLKQQLYELPKKIVSEIKDCLLDFSNGWWRYFVTDGCEYMLSSDLQGCLDEAIETTLKKYGGEDE